MKILKSNFDKIFGQHENFDEFHSKLNDLLLKLSEKELAAKKEFDNIADKFESQKKNYICFVTDLEQKKDALLKKILV